MKYELKNGWLRISADEERSVFALAEDYKGFLNRSKTERESVKTAVRLAKEAGFSELGDLDSLKAGDKVYTVNKNKAVTFAVIGKEPIGRGVRIVGAHVDAPRLDLKQNPLYEAEETALLKTHYYGGIKKYHWLAMPLALHGVVVLADGTSKEIAIGDEGDDITFTITDLLPHLATEQMKKTAAEFVEGEGLNILFGSRPAAKDAEEKERVKSAILKLLNETYQMSESDFLSAEIEVVPAYSAKDAGLDRSLIASYAHDDRVCAYTALRAILETENPQKTALCTLTDKEEVGSMGNTGAKSHFFRLFLLELLEKTGGRAGEIDLMRALDKSYCLSADVSAAFDPNYPSVHEKNNAAKINYGIAVSKYVGSRGKSGTNDASAEMMGFVRELFDREKVIWHTAEIGKVDLGGGGTIAQYVSNLGPETVDCGVPVLSMHSPYETVAKLDVYMAYKAFHAFFMK